MELVPVTFHIPGFGTRFVPFQGIFKWNSFRSVPLHVPEQKVSFQLVPGFTLEFQKVPINYFDFLIFLDIMAWSGVRKLIEVANYIEMGQKSPELGILGVQNWVFCWNEMKIRNGTNF